MTAAVMVWAGHVLELEVDRTPAPRSMLVTATLDSEDPRRFEELGWRELGIGVGEFPDVVRRAHVRGERLRAELANGAQVEIEIGARELF